MTSSVFADDVISVQPDGDVFYYDRLSYGWYLFAGGNNVQYGPVPGSSKVVVSPDGSVYIQDPLTANKMGTYIKAHLEGNKVVAEFPQVLGMIEDNTGKRPLYIGVMATFTDANGDTYMPVEDKSKDRVSWTIHDDGKITMDHREIPLTAAGKFADMENLPDSVLGTYYYGVDDLTGEYGAIWNAVGDWAQTYTPIHVEEVQTIPEGLNREVWRMSTKEDTRMVDVAFDGDVVYLGNITQYVPGAVKGYIRDGKAYFPTTQYLGFNEKVNANAWFISAIAVYSDPFGFGKLYLDHFERTDALEFEYDAEKKTLKSQPNACFLVNASTTETNHFEYVVDPNLQYLPPEGMNAKPVNPTILNPGEDMGFDGLLFSVDIPAVNVDGVELNTNDMFYNIYLNGELWTFYKDTYYYFGKDITDIPYNFTDKYDLRLRGSQHDLYLHESGIESIGIVSCFRGSDGVIYKSDLVSTAETTGGGEQGGGEQGEVDPGEIPSGRTIFAYAGREAETEPSGTGKAEVYDVAIAMTNPALVGKMITRIDVPVVPSTKVSDLSLWVAHELKTGLVGGKNVNIVDKSWPVEMPTEGDVQFVSLTLDKPYVIPEGGLYVGYSLTVDDVDKSIGAQVPIVTALMSKPGGFFCHTSRTFLNWADRSEELGVVAMIQVELAGDFHINAATLDAIPFSYLAASGDQTVSVPVHNIGLNPITSLQYRTTVGDLEYSGTKVLNEPIPAVFAYFEDVAFNVPAVDKLGDYDITVEITGVNDMGNDAAENTKAEGKATIVKFVPKKLALVEEFTGTWCGWCPAGFVAMEKMNELYPDFVGIAYHNTDPMAMKDGCPELASGYPQASVNRVLQTHPYEATGQTGVFSMPHVWESYCAGFVPVGIDLKAELDAGGMVTVNSSVEWVLPCDDPDSDYRVEYVLVADDLTGTTAGWRQKNYFSNEATMWDYMEQFWHQDPYIVGLHYNDVAILTSGTKGVDGSITNTDTGVANEYTYVFDTSKAVNADNLPIPFHNDKLRVIAFILKGEGYGTVVNAAKCKVDIADAVSVPSAATSSDTIYNLQGQKVGPDYKGVVIRNGRKVVQ